MSRTQSRSAQDSHFRKSVTCQAHRGARKMTGDSHALNQPKKLTNNDRKCAVRAAATAKVAMKPNYGSLQTTRINPSTEVVKSESLAS